MRGVLTMQAAKGPSAGLSARNWTKSKEAYPLLRATRTGRQDSAATPHEATHS